MSAGAGGGAETGSVLCGVSQPSVPSEASEETELSAPLSPPAALSWAAAPTSSAGALSASSVGRSSPAASRAYWITLFSAESRSLPGPKAHTPAARAQQAARAAQRRQLGKTIRFLSSWGRSWGVARTRAMTCSEKSAGAWASRPVRAS